MVEIRPFRGLRYDTARAGQASDLLAPPYDVIDAAQRAELAGRSAHNCVRVILPEGEGDARYTEGRRCFDALRADALVHDDAPGLYVYHQRFEDGEGAAFGFVDEAAGLISPLRDGSLELPLGARVLDVQSVDLNRDGWPDLLLLLEHPRLAILLQLGFIPRVLGLLLQPRLVLRAEQHRG